MKGTSKIILVALVGALASRAVYADLLCAGAEGISQACAVPCSNTVVNDQSGGLAANNGKFNVGGGNQGDGNTGFNNVGNFNIASGGKGNCLSSASQLTGYCDVNNNQGKVVLRFCQVYPTDNKCQPGGYLAEYSPALQAQIPLAVATCTGGAPYPPLGPPTATAPTTTVLPPAPTAPTVPVPTSAPVAPTPTTAPGPMAAVPPMPVVLPPGASMDTFTPVSDNKANLLTLLQLFEQHIAQEKALGRKLKM